MLTDSERFAFIPLRIHGFASSGHAYGATQCDEAIETEHTLVVLSESLVGMAGTWPIAVTAAHGALHSVVGNDDDTLKGLAQTFSLSPDDVVTAVQFARALGFALDPAFERVCPVAV